LVLIVYNFVQMTAVLWVCELSELRTSNQSDVFELFKVNLESFKFISLLLTLVSKPDFDVTLLLHQFCVLDFELSAELRWKLIETVKIGEEGV